MHTGRRIGGGLFVLVALALVLSAARANADSPPLVVSDPGATAHLAALDADRVLLEEEFDGGPPEIVLYEVASGNSLRLTDNDYPDDNASFDGRYAVWEGHVDGGDAEIFLYDLESRETRQLTDNDAEDLAPQIAGHLVAWGQRDEAGARVLLYEAVFGAAPGPVEELVPLVRAGKEVYMGATSSFSSAYQKYAGQP